MSIRSDIPGQVLIVTLDRPEVRNALSTQMVFLAQTPKRFTRAGRLTLAGIEASRSQMSC